MENTESGRREQCFEVREILGGDREYKAVGNGLTLDGMVLDTPPQLLEGNRFVWLEFGIPKSTDKIKALAEIVERTPLSVTVRFKHIFPDQRRRLAEYLTRTASKN